MSYDSYRQQMVLFGGVWCKPNSTFISSSFCHFSGETWVLADERWTQAATEGPAPRQEAAMAFDPVRNRTVLFGGKGGRIGESHLLDDTWVWDGARWTQLELPLKPPPTTGAQMVYDTQRQEILLLGGNFGKHEVPEYRSGGLYILTEEGWVLRWSR